MILSQMEPRLSARGIGQAGGVPVCIVGPGGRRRCGELGICETADMHVIDQAGVPSSVSAPTYVEQLRVPDLSVGTYRIPAGGVDEQEPHTEDEVYVVSAGRGRLWTPERTVDVGPGSVVFVPAHEEHRFVDVTEELTVLVVFGPAEYTRQNR